MNYYDQPIEGRTMVLTNDNENPGYSGDSLDYDGGQSGDYRVYWYWNPTNPSAGGITNISWPSDFDAHSESSPIQSLLQQLQNDGNREPINQAVYNYAHYHLFVGDWTSFRNTYNAGGVDCIREA